MDFRKKFVVKPGAKVRLGDIDPAYKGEHESHQTGAAELSPHRKSRTTAIQTLCRRQTFVTHCLARSRCGKRDTTRHQRHESRRGQCSVF
jgi:hypothetical protein